MLNIDDYDEQSWAPCPLTPGTIEEILNSASTSSSSTYNLATTPTDLNSSITSGSNSPTQFTPDFDRIFMAGQENAVDNFGFIQSPFDMNFSFPNPPNTFAVETPSIQYQNERLVVVAEPKAFYRGRYPSEIDNQKKRPKRFIRSENKDKKHTYPTVKIPTQWCHPDRSLYIRVTLVTVISETVPQYYIHPYEIGTPDDSVIEDLPNNSLYFRINEKEFKTGEKSFRLIVKKKKQDDFKSYGSLCLFDYNQPGTPHVQNMQDPKQIISTYQLWKSQFIFTIAERHPNSSLPVPIFHTSVESQIMTDTATDGQKSSPDPDDTFMQTIKYVPQKADWQGGDEVLVVMPYPIKQKVYSILVDFGPRGGQYTQYITPVDRKTFSFRTPQCPFLPGDEDLSVAIIIKENNVTFPPLDLCYITPMKTTFSTCSYCQKTIMDSIRSNKRKCEYDGLLETDGADSLISQMHGLSLEQKNNSCRVGAPSDESGSKLEQYLTRLRDGVATFLRTNDPSRLFCRSRLLLSSCDESSPPLNDAIQNGHTQLASLLVEQVISMSTSNGLLEKTNMNGETPLLVSAVCNEWRLIEMMLRKRCDLAEQKDNGGNNLLHILASVDGDKGADTINNVLSIIPHKIQKKLLKEQNKTGQKPAEVAQSHTNTSCLKILTNIATST